MIYKCLDCGNIFEDGEQARWSESRGEYWGASCSEEMSGCPLCKGDYEETTPCKICGSAHLEDELSGGVCEECINRYKKDFDMCYQISIGEKLEIKINALLASLLEESDIEAILIEYIKKRYEEIDSTDFVESDISWFGEKLAEEVKKNENAKKQS